MSDARKSFLDAMPRPVAKARLRPLATCLILTLAGPVLANAPGGSLAVGPVVCDLNGRTEVFAEPVAMPAVEGLARCRFEGSGKVERVVLVESQREIVRIEFNPDGRVRQLRCASRSRVAEDIRLCGWSGPQEVELFDGEGRRRASITHHEGQRVGYKTYFAQGSLDTEEQRLAGGVIELRRHHPSGGVRSVVVMQGEKRRSEQQFSPAGKLLRDIQWDEYQQRTQTDWSEAGRVQRRQMQSLFEGRSVTAVEEYWPNGLLRERSTRDANDQPIGLMQRFDDAGKLSEELIASDPQAGRVR